MSNFLNDLKELFSSTWTLLNDTNIFLSRTKVFSSYEEDLRNWRIQLINYPNNISIYKKIKAEIGILRKSLRKQGYDLKLGSKDIEIKGFRSDDATLKGYKRMVLFIHNNNIYYLSGEDNHKNLIKYLGLKINIKEIFSYPDIHSLWFRWKYNILEIRGADSESKDDFNKLQEYVESNKTFLLKKLAKLL